MQNDIKLCLHNNFHVSQYKHEREFFHESKILKHGLGLKVPFRDDTTYVVQELVQKYKEIQEIKRIKQATTYKRDPKRDKRTTKKVKKKGDRKNSKSVEQMKSQENC